MAKSPAWQRKEGKSPSGGLNAKGRASAKRQGSNLKAPVTQTFNYTGGVQSFTYPTNVTRVEAKLWGAGGSAQYGTINQYEAGAGGFTKGVIDASVGDK